MFRGLCPRRVAILRRFTRRLWSFAAVIASLSPGSALSSSSGTTGGGGCATRAGTGSVGAADEVAGAGVGTAAAGSADRSESAGSAIASFGRVWNFPRRAARGARSVVSRRTASSEGRDGAGWASAMERTLAANSAADRAPSTRARSLVMTPVAMRLRACSARISVGSETCAVGFAPGAGGVGAGAGAGGAGAACDAGTNGAADAETVGAAGAGAGAGSSSSSSTSSDCSSSDSSG